MHSGKYVFAQILSFVNRYEFNKCVNRYKGNRHNRGFTCWNQFVQLLFGQLSPLNSLRTISLCLKSHRNQLYHPGVPQWVDSPVLSRANEARDWHIFADFGKHLIKTVRPLYADYQIDNLYLDNEIFALDSTTISVGINLCTWAEGRYSRGAVKMHSLLNLRGSIIEFILITDGKFHDSNSLDEMIYYASAFYLMDRAYVDFEALFRIHNAGAFFVTRTKETVRYRVVEQNFKIDQTTGLRTDKTVVLTGYKSKKLYPEKLRPVEFYDRESCETLVFLANNFEVSALEVCILYKNRWQIEVFFKWIKQNLSVKHFWGYSENTVKTHLWMAVCTHLQISYIRQMLKSPLSTYETAQIVSTSLFDKTPLRELLCENLNSQINQNQEVKELLLF